MREHNTNPTHIMVNSENYLRNFLITSLIGLHKTQKN